MRGSTAVFTDEIHDVTVCHVVGISIIRVVFSDCQAERPHPSRIVLVPWYGGSVTVLPRDISQKLWQNIGDIPSMSSACFWRVKGAVPGGITKFDVRLVYNIKRSGNEENQFNHHHFWLWNSNNTLKTTWLCCNIFKCRSLSIFLINISKGLFTWHFVYEEQCPSLLGSRFP